MEKGSSVTSPTAAKSGISSPVCEDDAGSEKVQKFMTSTRGIMIIGFFGLLIFLIAIVLLNTMGSKAVSIFLFSVGGCFFILREILGGKKIKIK